MLEEIERALKILLGRIVQPIQPDEALKFTQSAANLTHLLNCYHSLGLIEPQKKKAGAS